jgi:hypothetical protein
VTRLDDEVLRIARERAVARCADHTYRVRPDRQRGRRISRETRMALYGVDPSFKCRWERSSERRFMAEPCLMQCACAMRASGGDGRQHATLNRRWTRHHVNGGFRCPTAIHDIAAAGTFSTIADIEMRWVLRQQCGGLLTVGASSSRTAASCISELTLSTQYRLLCC